MFIAIVQHTPAWVWGLLVALTAFGVVQTRDREMSLTRVTIVPGVLALLSLSGVLTAFGHSPVAIAAWAAGFGAMLVFARPAVSVRGASWSAQTGTLNVPGSWLPLGLMLGLFAIKYFVGVSVALHPDLSTDTVFGGLGGLAYGVFSGLFLARAMSLRSLAKGSPRLQGA